MELKKDKLYLIQGFYFQNKSGLDVGYDHTGAIGVIRTALCLTMYAGIIWYDHNYSVWLGEMIEGDSNLGHSSLSDIQLSQDMISFSKRYDNGRIVEYHFKKVDDSYWIGSFLALPGRREGESKCIITEISPDIAQPSEEATQQARKELKKYQKRYAKK